MRTLDQIVYIECHDESACLGWRVLSMKGTKIYGLGACVFLALHNLVVIAARTGTVMPFTFLVFDVVAIVLVLISMAGMRIEYPGSTSFSKSMLFFGFWVGMAATWRVLSMYYASSELFAVINGAVDMEFETVDLNEFGFFAATLSLSLFAAASVVYSIGILLLFRGLERVIPPPKHLTLYVRTVWLYVALNTISSVGLAIGGLLLLGRYQTEPFEVVMELAVPKDTSSLLIILTSLALGIKNTLVPYFSLPVILTLTVFFWYLNGQSVPQGETKGGKSKGTRAETISKSLPEIVCPNCSKKQPDTGSAVCAYCHKSLPEATSSTATVRQELLCWNCYELVPEGATHCPKCDSLISDDQEDNEAN